MKNKKNALNERFFYYVKRKNKLIYFVSTQNSMVKIINLKLRWFERLRSNQNIFIASSL